MMARAAGAVLYGRPTDMRKGFDGLSALVTQDLARDPLSGEVFIFVSRDRVRTKVLQWDGTGLCVYAKRLERGRFADLWREEGDPPIALTVTESISFWTGARSWEPSRCRLPRSPTFRLRRIPPDDQMLAAMVELTDERDVDTLRQISLLLDRENQRLIAKNLQLTAELARLRGVTDPEQLELALRQQLEQARAQALARETRPPAAAAPRPVRPGHGPRAQPALPSVEIHHALAPDQRACPACGGEVTAMTGQYQTSAR